MRLCIILALVSGLFLGAGCEVTTQHATVIQKVYEPSHTGIVWGGKRAQLVTIPESYTLVLQYEDGHAGSAQVNATTYASVQQNDHVTVNSEWYGVTGIYKESQNSY
jgi:hypothetical protein